MKNVTFYDVTPCGSCKKQRFGEFITSIIRVKRISTLGTTLAVTSNCHLIGFVGDEYVTDSRKAFLYQG
jgi:hypothetical protein